MNQELKILYNLNKNITVCAWGGGGVGEGVREGVREWGGFEPGIEGNERLKKTQKGGGGFGEGEIGTKY